jgi:serine/threonine protein kinase
MGEMCPLIWTFYRVCACWATVRTAEEEISVQLTVATCCRCLEPDAGRRKQMGREIRILSSLDHPNIARLLEVIEDDTSINLVLERCWGGELYDFINQLTFPAPGTRSWQDAWTGSMQPPQTVAVTEVHISKMVRQILLAIDYMHSRKIVHRDLKPENLMLLMPFAENQEPMIKVLAPRYYDVMTPWRSASA